MNPTFSATKRPGITLFDPIQDRRFEFETSSTVQPTPVDDDRFFVPTDAAVGMETAELLLPYFVETHVRHADGAFVFEVGRNVREELPEGEYCIELHAPIKIYLSVESAMTITTSVDRVAFDFDGKTTVRIGARSYHERPAETVTTTDDPADVMAAVSTFGSALKTTSPERSFPTLRGHPPAVELDDELDIPDGLTTPETGIRIEVPPRREYVYVAAPLAYYLGAEMVGGTPPRIVTDDGFEHPLDTTCGFDAEVERVLKQVLFLDCLVRTEGLYPVELHELSLVGDDIEQSLSKQYDAPIAERLASYLAIPFDSIRTAIPTWRLSVSVTPEAENATLLPYLIDELAVISRANPSPSKRPNSTPSYVNDFVRFAGEHRGETSAEEPYVNPSETDTLEQAWLGTGRPFGANKLLRSAFDHRHDRLATGGDIDIDIVCNDNQMRAEYDVDDGVLYGQRDVLPFDVDVHENLTTAELERLLASEMDFLHYIGHIDEHGFVCSDGTLDAQSLGESNVKTFFLNGCNSYRQGLGLVENGSVGGIVTHGDVGNDGAIAVGRHIARLLNAGFSLRSALSVMEERRIVANQYLVIGDGGVEVAQSESGTPTLYRLRTTAEGDYRVEMMTYPTAKRGIGSLYVPYLDSVDTYFLGGGSIPEFSVSATELVSLFQLEQLPVAFEGDLRWTSDLVFDLLI
ncbi:hypothetical protein [Haladaptatus sp. DFWS20]|uniref:hypothetical protein n=1 Tax=Haladaptatus sp. DFWS20 TaxID=3403467 RepID=UPI003EBA9805